MPHDKNGALLRVGDRVLLELTVRAVFPGAEWFTLMLARHVEGEQPLALACQATQVVKVDECSDGR
jgi:hypothetical protein